MRGARAYLAKRLWAGEWLVRSLRGEFPEVCPIFGTGGVTGIWEVAGKEMIAYEAAGGARESSWCQRS